MMHCSAFFNKFNPLINCIGYLGLDIEKSNLKVRLLEDNIFPFRDWEVHAPLFWWQTYNSIKHGHGDSYDTTLEVALNAIAALFLLHCEEIYSLDYLYRYSNTRLISGQRNRLHSIKSPLESRRFLFLYRIKEGSKVHHMRNYEKS